MKVAYYEERGFPCPDQVPLKPTLDLALTFYWNAFWELSADRPIGMTLGRIPFTSIDAYARRYGIVGTDAFERFRAIMREMDSELRGLSDPEKRADAVPVDDMDGVKNILSRVAKKGQVVES